MDVTLLKRRASDFVERSPVLYNKVQAYRLRASPALKRVVTKEHEIVIEGFPRCANSFSVRAFQFNNDSDRKVEIATHLHSTSSILLGVKWGIPTLVLIRNPDDAVPSFLSLGVQLKKTDMLTTKKLRIMSHVAYWTHRYTEFYNKLIAVQSKVVVGDFDLVTQDFNQIISALNDKFQCNYLPFEHTKENVNKIFDSAKVHLSPSAERDALKDTFKEFYFSKENEARRQKAKSVYERFRSS